MSDGSDSIVPAFYVTNPKCVVVGVTEAAYGENDGRSMILMTSPHADMPLLLDPDTVDDIVQRLAWASGRVRQQRAEICEG
jgi:hypothetical protein